MIRLIKSAMHFDEGVVIVHIKTNVLQTNSFLFLEILVEYSSSIC
jgi:hypothetical protein